MDDDNSGSIETSEFKNWLDKVDIDKLNKSFVPLCPGDLHCSQKHKHDDVWNVDENAEDLNDVEDHIA